jgi:hypothetical protein
MVDIEVSGQVPMVAVVVYEDDRDEERGVPSTRQWWSPPSNEVAREMSEEQVLSLYGIAP